MAQRYMVEFSASDPSDDELDAGGNVVRPAGHQLALALRSLLIDLEFQTSDVFQRDYYGWEMTGKKDGIKLLVVLQKSDRWLVIIEARSGFAGWSNAQVAESLAPLRRRLESDERFVGLTWRSEAEFKAQARGSA